jgi:hypothetical protein
MIHDSDGRRLNDRSFEAAVKSIVNRDFFPTLSSTHPDTSVDRYPTLNSFLATFASREISEFLNSVENDRQLLMLSAPVQEAPPSALFKSPEFCPPKAITFSVAPKRRIAYDQTRFGGRMGRDLQVCRPLPMDTSASETESEFEGRSQFRRRLLTGAPFVQIQKERLLKRKRTRKLSARGKSLFDALMEP